MRDKLFTGWLLPLFSLTVLSAAFPVRAQRAGEGQAADERQARFIWEGAIDGVTIIRINRRQVAYDNTAGLPVQRQRYEFSDALPLAKTELRLNVISGRGDVRLLEQPRESNEFTAVIRIDDTPRGIGEYAFELWWDRPAGGPRYANGEFFQWQGRVDGESLIRVRGESVWLDNLSGAGITSDRYQFTSPLPYQAQALSLVDKSGRGEILLLEQPNNRNDYTATVRIRDTQKGDGLYGFALVWTPTRTAAPPSLRDRSRAGQANGQAGDYVRGPAAAGPGLRWSGMVDGSDKLIIRAGELTVEHLSGIPVIGSEHRFFRALPATARPVSVDKRKGRGRVTIVEQPTAANGFTAVILIEDTKGGSEKYEIEVSW